MDLECVQYCVVYDSNTSSLDIILKDDDNDDNTDNNREGGFLH